MNANAWRAVWIVLSAAIYWVAQRPDMAGARDELMMLAGALPGAALISRRWVGTSKGKR